MPMTPPYQVAPLNEEDLKQAQVGFEAVRGTYTDPTFDWPFGLDVTGKRAVQDISTANGTFDSQTTFVMGSQDVTGTTGGNQEAGALAFNDIGIINRLGLGPGTTTPVSDGGTPAGYLWTGRPSASANDQGSLSAEFGHPDQVETASMLMVNEETLTIAYSNTSWLYTASLIGRTVAPKAEILGTATAATATAVTDTTKALTVNALVGAILQIRSGTGALQERTIVSNTATTITVDSAFTTPPAAGSVYRILPTFKPGVVGYARDLIPTAGTQFWLDDQVTAMGTTPVTERMISLSITLANNLGTKGFLENTDAKSARVRKGKRRITGQIEMEMDRARADEEFTEYRRYHQGNQINKSWRRLLVRQTGAEIRAGVPKYAELKIPRLHYTDYTKGNRDGNSTVTLAFSAYVDPAALAIIERNALNTLAAIPA